jgi:hypothetical protein
MPVISATSEEEGSMTASSRLDVAKVSVRPCVKNKQTNKKKKKRRAEGVAQTEQLAMCKALV